MVQPFGGRYNSRVRFLDSQMDGPSIEVSAEDPARPMPDPAPLFPSPPIFEPHPWARGGHAQTIMGRYLPGRRFAFDSRPHEIDLGDGDRLCVLESVPPTWSDGAPAAVLIHGLAGNAGALYLVRLAGRLLELGVRVVRMNLRGAGEGFGLARGIYHSGRSGDVRAVVDWFGERAPGSPIAVVGFSLGASLALRLAAGADVSVPNALDCVVAANPPIDLLSCALRMRERRNRVYDRSFARWLRAEAARLHQRFPDLGSPDLKGVRSIHEFDDRYTAPRNGFASAEDYYTRFAAGPVVPRIRIPGLVVHAADDPFIPIEAFRDVVFPPNVEFDLRETGGHMGFISRSPWRGDHRWLETRLADWLARRWSLEDPG